jgi:hypothetical protein
MKTEYVVNFAIKVVMGVLSCCGVFTIFGSVGSLECTDMTMLQFCFQELIAVSLIGLALVVYFKRDMLNEQILLKIK